MKPTARSHQRVKRIATSLSTLPLVSAAVVIASIWADWGSESWTWFQRSGSFIALTGGVLGYRSIMRMGVDGVGGANTAILRGKVESVDDSGPVQKVSVSYDEDTRRYLHEATLDSIAGYLGAFLILLGTLIWGYGDLLGRVLA